MTLLRISALALFLLVSFLLRGNAQSMGAAMRADNRAAMANWIAYQNAKASGKNLKGWWKGESTFGLAFTQPFRYTARTTYIAPEGGPVGYNFDTSIRGTGQMKTSYHVNFNANSLLVRLAPSSIVSFSWGIDADWLRGSVNSFVGNNIRKVNDVNMEVVRMGVPLTLDFKSGTDVDWDRQVPFAFSAGAGFMPGVTFATNGYVDAQSRLTTVPYLYGTVGFFAGIMWKVRATYKPGAQTFIRNSQEIVSGAVNTLNVTGGSVFTIGVASNSFSYDWGRGNAYRTGGGGGSRARRKPGRGRGSFDGGNIRMF